MKVFLQAALVVVLAIFATIAPAREEGVCNPSSNCVGVDQGIDSNKASGVVAFTGPGDVQTTGVVAWFGLRAYSSAKRGTAVANVCNSTGGVDVGCADMLSNASTGALVPQTINGIPCPGANCTIKILYDQSGAGSCTVASVAGQPCNLGNLTVAGRPTLATATTMTFLGSASQKITCDFNGLCALTSSTIAQPYEISAVVERTATFTTKQMYFGDSGGNMAAGWAASANTLDSFAPTDGTVGSIADSAYHAVQVQPNGASGVIYVDGSSNTLNLGANAFSGTARFGFIGVDNFSEFMTGNVEELGVWSGDQSSHFSAMNSNQHTFWGF